MQRQSALRFGREVAAHVARAVERLADPERLTAAGEWIVRAASGEELVARLARIADDENASPQAAVSG